MYTRKLIAIVLFVATPITANAQWWKPFSRLQKNTPQTISTSTPVNKLEVAEKKIVIPVEKIVEKPVEKIIYKDRIIKDSSLVGENVRLLSVISNLEKQIASLKSEIDVLKKEAASNIKSVEKVTDTSSIVCSKLKADIQTQKDTASLALVVLKDRQETLSTWKTTEENMEKQLKDAQVQSDAKIKAASDTIAEITKKMDLLCK